MHAIQLAQAMRLQQLQREAAAFRQLCPRIVIHVGDDEILLSVLNHVSDSTLESIVLGDSWSCSATGYPDPDVTIVVLSLPCFVRINQLSGRLVFGVDEWVIVDPPRLVLETLLDGLQALEQVAKTDANRRAVAEFVLAARALINK